MPQYIIPTDAFTDNPDKWGREISEQIELQIILMNRTLPGILSADLELIGEMDFAGIPRLQNMNEEQRKKQLQQTIIDNTFLSIFRDVVVYIDKLLSMYLFGKLSKEKPLGPVDDLYSFFENLPMEEYVKLTRNPRLNFPEKLKLLSTLEPRSKERLGAYNKIRVAFEHHGGIPKHDIVLPISSIVEKINQEGIHSVTIRLDKVEYLKFKNNELITLMPQDVTLIGYDIKGWIIKDLLIALEKLDGI